MHDTLEFPTSLQWTGNYLHVLNGYPAEFPSSTMLRENWNSSLSCSRYCDTTVALGPALFKRPCSIIMQD